MLVNKTFAKTGIRPSGTLEITENGEYDVTNYANANVDIPEKGGEYDVTFEPNEDGETQTITIIEPTIEETLPIDLPADFKDVKSIYYFNLDDNILLFSSNIPTTGTYSYNKQTKVWTKIFESGQFSRFYKIGNNCILFKDSTTNVGFHIYDSSLNTVEQVYNYGYFTSSGTYVEYISDDKVLINLMDGGVVEYNNTTKIATLKTTRYWFRYFKNENNNNIMYMGTGHDVALGGYYYIYATNTFETLADIGKGYDDYKAGKLFDDYFVYCVANNKYFRILDLSTKTYIQSDTLSANPYLLGVIKLNNKYLITSGAYSIIDNTYGWLFDGTNLTSISLPVSRTRIIQTSNTSALLLTTNTSADFMYEFNTTTNAATITNIPSNSVFYNYNNNNKWLIFSQVSSVKGLFKYDATAHSITTLDADGYYIKEFAKIDDTVLYISNTSSVSAGFYLYNITTDTFSHPYTTGYLWNTIYKIPNKNVYLISYDANGGYGGIFAYDVVAGTITRLIANKKCMYDSYITFGNDIILNCGYIDNSGKFYSEGVYAITNNLEVVTIATSYIYDIRDKYIIKDNVMLVSCYKYSSFNITAYLYDNTTHTVTQLSMQLDSTDTNSSFPMNLVDAGNIAYAYSPHPDTFKKAFTIDTVNKTLALTGYYLEEV